MKNPLLLLFGSFVACFAQDALADHMFFQFGNPDIAILPGEGAEFRIGGTRVPFTPDPLNDYAVIPVFGFLNPAQEFTLGDKVRFTMGGQSLLFNFGDPGLQIFSSTSGGLGARQAVQQDIVAGDLLATNFSNNDSPGDTFTLELLEGDGVLLRGFFLADSIDQERIEGAGFQFLRSFDVEVIPEPTALAIWSVLGGIGVAARPWRCRRKK